MSKMLSCTFDSKKVLIQKFFMSIYSKPVTISDTSLCDNDEKFVSVYEMDEKKTTQFNIHRYLNTMKNSSNVSHKPFCSCSGVILGHVLPKQMRCHQTTTDPIQLMHISYNACVTHQKCGVIGCGMAHLSGRGSPCKQGKTICKGPPSSVGRAQGF